jgi:hypothetical protein
MSWNYRIIKHIYSENENPINKTTKKNNQWLAIHEVYYDKNNKPTSCTLNPIAITSNNKKELKWIIEKIKKATKKPILNENIFDEKATNE